MMDEGRMVLTMIVDGGLLIAVFGLYRWVGKLQKRIERIDDVM